MRVLIIGGTGLISTALTRQLLQRGDDVSHSIVAAMLMVVIRRKAGVRT